MSAPVTTTAATPSASGSAAAASDPKTTSRTISTIGRPMSSACSRSSFESCWIPAQSALWPTRCSGTAAPSGVDLEVLAHHGGGVDGLVAAARRRRAASRSRRARRRRGRRPAPAGSAARPRRPRSPRARRARTRRPAPAGRAPGCRRRSRGPRAACRGSRAPGRRPRPSSPSPWSRTRLRSGSRSAGRRTGRRRRRARSRRRARGAGGGPRAVRADPWLLACAVSTGRRHAWPIDPRIPGLNRWSRTTKGPSLRATGPSIDHCGGAFAATCSVTTNGPATPPLSGLDEHPAGVRRGGVGVAQAEIPRATRGGGRGRDRLHDAERPCAVDRAARRRRADGQDRARERAAARRSGSHRSSRSRSRW